MEIEFERDERPLVQRDQDRWALVEQRIVPFAGVLVVNRHGRAEGADRHLQFGLDLFPGLAGAGNAHPRKVHRLDEMRIVEQQVDLAVRLIDRAAADPAVVAVFIDEALALGVDEDAIGVAFRHGPGAGGEELLHVDRITARADAQFDSRSVVLVADRIVKLEGFGAVLAPHRLVEHEAAGRKNHTLGGPDEARLVVDPYHQADNPVAVLHQRQRARIGHHLDALGPGAGFQHIDQRPPPAPAHVLDHVAAWGGLGEVAKRRRRLAARPDQG